MEQINFKALSVQVHLKEHLSHSVCKEIRVLCYHYIYHLRLEQES